MKQVVGTLFFKDGKLLIVKPRKRPTFQLVGGSVEYGEEILAAAIRECHEELAVTVVYVGLYGFWWFKDVGFHFFCSRTTLWNHTYK